MQNISMIAQPIFYKKIEMLPNRKDNFQNHFSILNSADGLLSGILITAQSHHLRNLINMLKQINKQLHHFSEMVYPHNLLLHLMEKEDIREGGRVGEEDGGPIRSSCKCIISCFCTLADDVPFSL